MTNATLLFGKNKVFIVDYFSQLDHFGLEDNLYIVRLADDGTEDNKMYEWRDGGYVPFSFGSGGNNEPIPVNEASIEVYDERKDLPLPMNAKHNTLYVVLMDITAERKTTMYLFVDGSYMLLAAFSAGGSIQEYTQVTKLGVEANVTAPRTYEIAIPRTTNFLRAPIEVLKFTQGNQEVVRTAMDFDNGDATDFEENNQVAFDGVMKLLPTRIEQIPMTLVENTNGVRYVYSVKVTDQEKYDIKRLLLNTSVAGSESFILHDGEYKTYDSIWETVSSTLPTQEQFLVEGMDSLSPLLDRRVETLEPLEMTDKSEILVGEEVSKVFSKTLDLRKYLDIRSMKVDVK